MKPMDPKILIIIAVLIVAVGFIAFSGNMPGVNTPTTTITVTTSPPTTTVYTPPPTTTVTEETTTTPEETTNTTTNETVAETCNEICVSEGFGEGTCRPSCLSYEHRSESEATDCTGIYKCCCD